MIKEIKINIFDPESIENAVDAIRDYSVWVRDKTVELRKHIAEEIRNRAQPIFDSAIADDLIGEGAVAGEVYVNVEDNGEVSVVIAEGEDAVFMEFGAGVYHNGSVGSSPHPLGAALGFTIGGYGLGNGTLEMWWFRGTDGQVHLTHGTPASMPMYKSMMAVVNDIERIAREVFRT